MLMDGYPTSYMSFSTRLYRWLRGDYQILPWLKKTIENKKGHTKNNPLNLLSKYKIFSNIIRSKQETAVFVLLCFSWLVSSILKINLSYLAIIAVISIITPTIIDIVNSIISKKQEIIKTKKFVKTIDGLKASFWRAILDILVIPDKMYLTTKAEYKTIYRMTKSKKHLLEWITSEEAEKTAKTDMLSYYKNMVLNTIIGILGIIIAFSSMSICVLVFSILWLIAPGIMCKISQKNKEEKPINELTSDEKKYILDVGYKTWLYFKESITEKSNYLPPDNYQEDRKPKFVMRTSSTNIGLALLAVVASYDLGYESFESTINLLYKMVNTITNLAKWNGHLYNWYNIENLEPLVPRYISSVDSGNFVGYLYVLKQFLIDKKKKILEYNSAENHEIYQNYNSTLIEAQINNYETTEQQDKIKYDDKYKLSDSPETNEKINSIIEKIDFMITSITQIIENTDFTKLYDPENRLFSVGFNVEDNKLTDSYYDLLASEARQTSLVAIAKKDIPEKHWYNLSRTLTTLNNYKGLISWSGTSFEYLMPTVNIAQYPGSILDESCKFMIMSQIEYSKKLGTPWGISEAAFNLKDLNNNYQYKAFGIPWLGLKRGLSDEIVISSYGSILAINEAPKLVIENLKKLQSEKMYDKYGFYESIDFTPR